MRNGQKFEPITTSRWRSASLAGKPWPSCTPPLVMVNHFIVPAPLSLFPATVLPTGSFFSKRKDVSKVWILTVPWQPLVEGIQGCQPCGTTEKCWSCWEVKLLRKVAQVSCVESDQSLGSCGQVLARLRPSQTVTEYFY